MRVRLEARLAFATLVAAACLVMPGCDSECGEDFPPVGIIAHLGLFAAEPYGEPMCIADADITTRQGRLVFRQARRSLQWHVTLLPDRRMDVVRVGDPCTRIEHDVLVQGCEPVSAVFVSPHEETLHFAFPVFLTCTDPPIDGTIDGGPFPRDGPLQDAGP